MRTINEFIIIQIILFSYVANADNHSVTMATGFNNSQYLQVTGVKNNDTLNLRKSPGNKSEIVYTLLPNAKGILKLDESEGWIQVSYKEKTGCVYGKYLKNSHVPGVTSDIHRELFCIGTEPHWLLKTSSNKITYKKYDDEVEFLFNSSFEKQKSNNANWSFSAINKNDTSKYLKIEIEHNEQCSDEMSDNKYTYSIRIKDEENGVLSGCCK